MSTGSLAPRSRRVQGSRCSSSSMQARVAREKERETTVDVHSHYLPPTVIEAVEDGSSDTPAIEVVREVEQGLRFKLGNRSPTRPLAERLLDLEERRLWMDEMDVGTQVLAPWVDVFGYHLPSSEGVAWSRLLNASMQGAISGSRRFAALATVPMQDPMAAAKILAEAIEAGFRGVMIGTRVGERELDSQFFEPFWSAASELGAVVFLHPNSEAEDPRLEAFGLMNAVGRVHDTTVAAARLLYAGVPTRYTGAKIVLSHGGGTLPYVLGRLAKHFSIGLESAVDPQEGFERLYFDSVVSDPAALRLLVDKAGPNRVMLGSDYPFPIGDLEPGRVTQQTHLEDPEERLVREETARNVFSLPDVPETDRS